MLTRSPEKASPRSEPELPFVGLEAIAPDSMNVGQTTSFGAMKSLGSRFRAGDVLYGRLRPYLNKVWHADREGACSGELLVLQTNGKLDPSFLTYRLHGREFVEYASHAVTGDRPRLDFKQLAAFQTALPPIETQRRIVAYINELFSELDDGEEELRLARADMEIYRKALLKAAVMGELTADWRGATREEAVRPETDEPDIHNLQPRLPKRWAWRSVGSLLDGDIQNGLYLPQTAYGRGVPIIRIDDFQAGNARPIEQLRLVDANPQAREVYRLRAGDYVINRVNSPSHLGKSFLVRERHESALFESNMMRLRPSEDVDGDFFELYLSSYLGRARLCRNAKAAVNQASINQTDVKSTMMPLPPLDEQHEIVRLVTELRVSASDDTFDELENASATLRQSILAAAFRGELVQ